MQTTMKGEPMAKPSEMSSMHIEKAANGFTVETRRKPKPHKENLPYDYEADREQRVFNNVEDMLGHIREMCGGGKAKHKKG